MVLHGRGGAVGRHMFRKSFYEVNVFAQVSVYMRWQKDVALNLRLLFVIPLSYFSLLHAYMQYMIYMFAVAFIELVYYNND